MHGLLLFLQEEKLAVTLISYLAVATLRRKVLPVFTRGWEQRHRETLFTFFWYTLSCCAILACSDLSTWIRASFNDHRIVRGTVPSILLLVALGYYLDEVAHLVFESKPKKDHHQMAAHHLITIACLSLSSILTYSSAVLTVILLHDICDVVLNLAKLLHKFKYHRAKVVAFGALILTWAVCRLILFPAVMRAIWLERPPSASCVNFYCYFLFVGWAFVPVLYAMDWIWFCMIIRIALRPTITDSRESDSDDEDVPKTPKENTEDHLRQRKGTKPNE